MAIVVSSLTDEIVDPTAMAKWAYEHSGWCKGQGSYHSPIPNAAKAWDLSIILNEAGHRAGAGGPIG